MASCAAGKTSRVYDQHMELMCKFMVRTWGHLFKANEKKNIKNTCEPAKFTSPCVYFAISPFACMHFWYLLIVYPHFIWSPHVI